MLGFKEYLSESTKNKHIYHLDELVLFNGSLGARIALQTLINIRDSLRGNMNKAYNITIKWDGAPSIIAGVNPENGKFFVGTKGVFAKTPKLNYTDADIDRNHQGGVVEKLKIALKYLPNLKYDGIYQGDFLFDKDILKKKKINGEEFLTFTPNTLTYAIPLNSDLAYQMSHSKIGFAVHTAYTGKSIEDMKANFNISKKNFRPSQDVWLTDSHFRDLSGIATFTKREYEDLNDVLSQIGKVFRTIDPLVLNRLKDDHEFSILIASYANSKVRKGEAVKDFARYTQDLKVFIRQKFEKEISKLKTDAAILSRKKLINKYVGYIENNILTFKKIFYLQSLLNQAKLIIIEKLNQLNGMRSFIEQPDGSFKVSPGEGFVASDNIGNIVKLVDRLDFSFNNFNKIKDWS